MTAVGERVTTLRNVRIPRGLTSVLTDEPVDVFLDDGAVIDLAPRGNLPARGAAIDGDGAWLLPGLWDHHVHVVQWALVAERQGLGSAASAVHAARIMGATPPMADGRRIGTGFRDALWPDAPSLAILDAATGEIPTYLINADVHSVWLNSAALRREGVVTHDSGVLREEAAFEISRRLNAVEPAHGDRLVQQMAQDAASRGVVGFIDFDMAWNEEAWARRLAGGFDTQHVEFGIYPEHLERAVAEGLRSGEPVRGAASALVCVGSLKVITDGSLGTRTAACSHAYPGDPHNRGQLTVDPERLVELMTIATAAGLSCAVHAIGDTANSHALDAFARTEAWGTIEHAQLVAHADIPRFARLGVAASVQPEHAIDDRDLTDSIWAAQTAQPYPLRALADAGASLRFGSDAPVSPLDPWAAIAAAVFRTRDGRSAWQPEQGVTIATALAASMFGGSRVAGTVEPGSPADLMLCTADPTVASEQELRAMSVSATLLGGRLTHRA